MTKPFKVRFTEFVYHEVTVDADSVEQATAKAEQEYANGTTKEIGSEIGRFDTMQAGAA